MNQTTESQRQELAGRLVHAEVGNCVSTLMSGIMEISSNLTYCAMQDAFCTDQDELMGLFQRPDYEEAARRFIMDDAYNDQLEEMADEYGDWSDVLKECLPEITLMETDEDGTEHWLVSDGCDSVYDNEDDAREAAIEHALPTIRKAVWSLVNTQDEFTEMCQKYDLDLDYIEVYEHWIVSDWLARKLQSRGEITGDFAGLTIWGRCCSGQSMTLDSVIQEIAVETL